MRTIPTNPFRVEELRAALAESHQYSALRATYSPAYPEIKNANTRSFWDSSNPTYQAAKHGYHIAHHRLHIFRQLLSRFPHHLILNVGAGSGVLEEVMEPTGVVSSRWFGIDIAASSIKSLKQQYPQAHFQVAKAQHLPFKDKFFDVICMSEVLEHISPRDTFTVLSELKRVLKKNGTLIMSVPLNEGLEFLIQKGENPSAHVRVYTFHLLQAELEISGFDVVTIKRLYAFRSYYWLKTLVANLIPGLKQHNNLIVVAQKK